MSPVVNNFSLPDLLGQIFYCKLVMTCILLFLRLSIYRFEVLSEW